jgi:hypothetical protein
MDTSWLAFLRLSAVVIIDGAAGVALIGLKVATEHR